METISSKNNSVIKDTKKLLTSSKERKSRGLFVLEGARLCFDALNSDYELDTLLVTEHIQNKYMQKTALLENKCNRSYLITEDIAKKLGETANSQGIFLVCKQKGNATVTTGKKCIALDNVQDPSNLGAIIRTAEALGIDCVIAAGGCDIYNPKAIRASMGSVLRQPLIHCESLGDMLTEMKSNGYLIFVTVPDSAATKITEADLNGKTVCVIGNEANGVSDCIKEICDDCLTIPMLGRAESLNASVAASIVMWEMMR